MNDRELVNKIRRIFWIASTESDEKMLEILESYANMFVTADGFLVRPTDTVYESDSNITIVNSRQHEDGIWGIHEINMDNPIGELEVKDLAIPYHYEDSIPIRETYWNRDNAIAKQNQIIKERNDWDEEHGDD